MTKPHEFDLVVYGGTPGGIACAVRAAREGLSVGLVNVTRHLGGMLASGLGLFDALFSGQRCPIASEVVEGFLRHYETKYGRDSENYRSCEMHQAAEAHVAEAVLTAIVRAESRITVFLGWYVVGAETAGRGVIAIELAEFFDGSRRLRLEGRAFVDASYEGDLLAAAGAPYRVGREDRSEFGEPHAGKIFTRYEEGNGPVYPYEAAKGLIKLRPFDLCTGRIFPGSTGEGDRAIQAYNFRIALTRDPANRVPISKPEKNQRENYLGLLQGPDESLGTPHPVKSKWLLDDIRAFKFRNHRTMPNRKVTWNH
jgi:hypothetical protein